MIESPSHTQLANHVRAPMATLASVATPEKGWAMRIDAPSG